MGDAAQEKRSLRVELKARRARIGRDAAAAAAGAVRDRLLRDFPIRHGAVVAGYWPIGEEFDLRPTLDALHAQGCILGLPVVLGRGQPLAFRAWEPGAALVPGGFGTSVPAPDSDDVTPRLLLVPLLGFDRRGHRLGYGGGFYDMTIAALRARVPDLAAIGVAFAGQEVAALPVEAFDRRLDAIVTERESLVFAGARP